MSKPEVVGGMPWKRRNGGAPHKKARGRKDRFLYPVNRKKVGAAEHAKAKPHGLIAHRDDFRNKATYGVKVKTVNKFFFNDNEAASASARAWATSQALTVPDAASAGRCER